MLEEVPEIARTETYSEFNDNHHNDEPRDYFETDRRIDLDESDHDDNEEDENERERAEGNDYEEEHGEGEENYSDRAYEQ